MEIIRFKQTVWDLLRGVSDSMDCVFRPIINKYGLTMIQMRILLELEQDGEHTVGSIGKALCIANGNVSSMCKKLEECGFLQRERNQSDQRVVLLVITTKGRQTVSEINHFLEDKYSCVVENVDTESLNTIVKGLESLNAILNKMSHCE